MTPCRPRTRCFLVGSAYAALGQALHAAGLEYCNTDVPTGVLTPDGRHQVLSTSRKRNLAAFGADGRALAAALDGVAQRAPLLFPLMGSELWRLPVGKPLAGAGLKGGGHNLAGFVGEALQPARTWLTQAFQSDLTLAPLAPWVLHCGGGPDAPLSALLARIVAFNLEAVGMPMVKGGNANTVRAFETLVHKAGGEFVTGADAERVLVERGRARVSD